MLWLKNTSYNILQQVPEQVNRKCPPVTYNIVYVFEVEIFKILGQIVELLP